MQSPIREQLRINDRWQARQLSSNAARIFVPGPWAERRVVLSPEAGMEWSAAHIGERSLERDPETGNWQADNTLTAGQWNTVSAEDGEITGAKLTASSVLHISQLEVSCLLERGLSIRIQLAGHEQLPGGTAPTGLAGRLLTLYFTLTTPSGEELGGMDVTIAPKTRGLSIEMPLPRSVSGTYRLKACLCSGETVIDNARITVNI